MPKEKTNRINLYRIDPKFSFKDIDPTDDGYELDYDCDKIKFYVQRNKTNPVAWKEYFSVYLDGSKKEPLNSSSSFIFLFKNEKHCYVIPGGTGFTKIADYIDDEFGLEIAIRMIKENKLTGIHQKSLKGTTRQIYRAVSGYNSIFDKENYNRILNSVQGKGEFENKTFSIGGKACLQLRTGKTVQEIDEVISEVENIEKRVPVLYFPKSYKVVKDKILTEELNSIFLDNFNKYWQGNGDRDRFYLELEDAFSQFECDLFEIRYNHKKIEVNEFDLDLIREKLINESLVKFDSADDMQRIRISGKDVDGLYKNVDVDFQKAIVAEVTHNGDEYIKFGKKWLCILDEIQKYLNDEVTKIRVVRNVLPAWDETKHLNENAYNQFAAKKLNYHCLDADLITLKGGSKLEVCDIYDDQNNVLYHVKKTWGSKSSYLFLQGTTSLEYLINSKDFRNRCKQKWPKLFSKKMKSGTVFYGIADKGTAHKSFPLNLTFFAKLNLVKAASDIRSLGFDVAISPIESN